MDISTFDAYIDDACLSAIGSRSCEFQTILDMASLLLAAVKQMLGSFMSLDKVALICSRPRLGKQLEEALGALGRLETSAVNLGRDDAAGAAFRWQR